MRYQIVAHGIFPSVSVCLFKSANIVRQFTDGIETFYHSNANAVVAAILAFIPVRHPLAFHV